MVAPSRFCHVVYKTHRYDEMIDWYVRVFEARIQHSDNKLTFLTYDDEHHRFAMLNLGPGTDRNASEDNASVGVLHVAYAWNDIASLLGTYKRLKEMGVRPATLIRHGVTLSLYYKDPDGNGMEFQIDLLSPDDANRFMASPAWKANPIGEPWDPDLVLARYEAGHPVDELIFRSDQPELARRNTYVKGVAGPALR